MCFGGWLGMHWFYSKQISKWHLVPNERGDTVLIRTHARPFLQIGARAEDAINFTRQDQSSRRPPLVHPSCTTESQLWGNFRPICCIFCMD